MMRRILIHFTVLGSLLVSALASAQSPGVLVKATSAPIDYHATCAAAGGFILEFTQGTVITAGTEIIATLDEGVVLCQDIDLEISSGGETSSWTGSLASEGNIPPSGAPVTDPTQTSRSGDYGVYFLVRGDAGASEIRVLVLSSWGFGSLAVGEGFNDKIILRILTQETNAANFTVQPGIYTDPDGNEVYTDPATRDDNTLFINVSKWNEDTVEASFYSTANYVFSPPVDEIAHISRPYSITAQAPSLPIPYFAGCDEAGGITLSFGSGATIRPGDYVTINLTDNAALCRDIDLQLSAGGSETPWSGAAAKGGNVPVAGSPLNDPGQRSVSTGGGVYFKVTGSQGSSKVKVSAHGADGASLTAGSRDGDSLVLEVLTQKTNSDFYKDCPGVYVASDLDRTYSVPATAQDTTLCIDVSGLKGDSVPVYLTSVDKFLLEPEFLEVAYLVPAVAYQQYVCPDSMPGQIAVPSAGSQTCFAFNYESGAGYVPQSRTEDAAPRLIIATDAQGAYFPPGDYQVELKILTPGIYWSNDPVYASGYSSGPDACIGEEKALPAGDQASYQYWTAGGKAGMPAMVSETSGLLTCSQPGDAVTLRTDCAELVGRSTISALAITMPRLAGDPAAVKLGSEVLVRLALFDCPCRGQVFSTTLSLGLLASAQEEGSFRAVIVGVSDYPGTIEDLSFSDDDAAALQRTLLGFSSWQPENIAVLSNQEATMSAIMGAIQSMGDEAAPMDTCLFFFSGYGTNLPDVAPLEESDGRDEALVVYDGMLYDDEISSALAALPTGKVVAIIDASFSRSPLVDAILSRGRVKCLPETEPLVGAGDGFVADIFAGTGVKSLEINSGVAISASADESPCWEFDRLQSGVLTYALVRAMQAHEDPDGIGGSSAEEIGAATIQTFETFYSRFPNLYRFLEQMPELHDAYPAEAPGAGDVPLGLNP